MLAAFEAGRTVQQLCEDHGLSDLRVRALLADERNRQALSPEPFYRKLRQARSSS
jgi:hypothetical protein